MLTLTDDKEVVSIRYLVEPADYEEYLPLVDHMINSFKLEP